MIEDPRLDVQMHILGSEHSTAGFVTEWDLTGARSFQQSDLL